MDGLRAPGINGRGVELVVVSLTFLGVAALMVGVRMATKRALKKLWERDDWLILAALVSINHYCQSFWTAMGGSMWLGSFAFYTPS